MSRQSYQQLFKVIEEDIREMGDKKLNKISKDFQDYFYNSKQTNPKRYERLTFDTNGSEPFSSDLEDILRELRGRVIGTRLYIIKER